MDFVSQHQPASISSLPTEILILVFGIVNDDGRVLRFKSHSGDHEGIGEMDIPVNVIRSSKTLFPYSILSVCHLWKEIVISVPRFWTRLVVALETGSKWLAELESHLQYSHNLPFEVCLSAAQDTADGEMSCLSTALETLSPHLHRWQGLHIFVQRSSSLPPFSRISDLLSTCNDLKKLSLQCSTHDACVEPCPIASGSVMSPVAWSPPPVTHLSLSADCLFLYRHLFRSSPLYTIHSLTLTNYDARICPGERGLTISSLIDMLRGIQPESVELINLNFGTSFIGIEPLGGAEPWSVYCEDLQGEVLSAICLLYRLYPVHDLAIISSSLNGVPWFVTIHLYLQDISKEQGKYTLNVFDRWDGLTLTVARCPFFDDVLLGKLAETNEDEMYPCHNLRELDISDCPEVSVPALKRFVEHRWKGARDEFEWRDEGEMEGHAFVTVSPIVRLVVDAQLGALFSEEDLEWFQGKLRLEIASQ